MTHDFRLIQGIYAAIDNRAAAWKFIRGFAAAWATPLRDADGWDEAELEQAETRLGIMLPPTLREAYALFGRRPDLTSNHDVLLDPSQLHLDDRRDALVFRHENQGAASWGILVSDLGHADPTVFMRPDLADKTAERWEIWLGCLSLAFIEIILSECLHGPKGLCDFLPELDDNQLTLLERHYMPVPFPTYPPPRDGAPGTRWFTGPDVLLREDDRAVLFVRGRTSRALDQVHDIVQGDWIN